MALRRILTFPEESLKEPSTVVENIDGRVAELVRDMAETMYDAPGVGLAAPQVGVNERIIVVDIAPEGEARQLVQLINPVIVEREGSIVWEEGCLSVVDYTAEVTRARRVLVQGWTPDQKEIRIEAEELMAVALQHEIDHLDGKLFLDRISRLKRDLYRRRVQKWMRDGNGPDRSRPAGL